MATGGIFQLIQNSNEENITKLKLAEEKPVTPPKQVFSAAEHISKKKQPILLNSFQTNSRNELKALLRR